MSEGVAAGRTVNDDEDPVIMGSPFSLTTSAAVADKEERLAFDAGAEIVGLMLFF